jgi:hypothetical protein
MSRSERLSIDITVVRDFLDLSRPRHQEAQELFALADGDEVELIVAPQGYRDDVPEGTLREQLQGLITSGHVSEARQLARLSNVTYPSKNLFPGQFVRGFQEAWQAVIDTWKTHEAKPPGDKDRWHVETHILEGADVFLTDDRPLCVMCRRLHDEHEITIDAMGLGDYLKARKQVSS